MIKSRLNQKFWRDLAKFLSLLKKHAWRMALQVKAWRRFRSANLVRQFLLDAKALGGSVRVVSAFSTKVRKVQAFAVKFLECTRARHEFIRGVMGEVAAEVLAETQALLDEQRSMSDLKVVKKKSATGE